MHYRRHINLWFLLISLTLVGEVSLGLAKDLSQVKGKGCALPIDLKETKDKEMALRGMGIKTKRSLVQIAELRARENAVENYSGWKKIAQTFDVQSKKELLDAIIDGAFQDFLVIDRKPQDDGWCISAEGNLSLEAFNQAVQRTQNNAEIISSVTSREANPKSDFDFKLRVNRSDYRYVGGDAFIVFVEIPKTVEMNLQKPEVYFKLDYYQQNGCVVHLVPNKFFDTPSTLELDRSYQFPRQEEEFEFIVEPPFGREYLKAWASTEPFDKTWNASEPQECGVDRKRYANLQLRGMGIHKKRRDQEAKEAKANQRHKRKIQTRPAEPQDLKLIDAVSLHKPRLRFSVKTVEILTVRKP
ncbi:MAG: hypothetical protein NPIRA04_10740 [Nitrospirales bacterium]|nr:MAG: hypothetical protein NPIRA04_10740 [Nitrospirales bacterium]